MKANSIIISLLCVFFVANVAAATTAIQGMDIATNVITGLVILVYILSLCALRNVNCSRNVRLCASLIMLAYTVFVGVRLIMFVFGNDA